jgi:hypothetical protein
MIRKVTTWYFSHSCGSFGVRYLKSTSKNNSSKIATLSLIGQSKAWQQYQIQQGRHAISITKPTPIILTPTSGHRNLGLPPDTNDKP